MKLKLFFVCLLFTCFGTSFSQGLYWSLNTGANFGRTTWGSFQDYSEAYNYQNYDLLKSRLSPMKWTRGYNFGASFIATNDSEKGIYIELENESKFASTSAEFIDPALGTRHYKVRYSSNIITIGMASSIDGKLVILGGYFLGANNIFLESYKEYGDGQISYGMENGTNAKYRMKRFTTGFNFGVDYIVNRFLVFNVGLKLGATLFGAQDIEIPMADGPFPFNSVTRSGVLSVGIKFTPVNTY